MERTAASGLDHWCGLGYPDGKCEEEDTRLFGEAIDALAACAQE
jgi:hypothetical protein